MLLSCCHFHIFTLPHDLFVWGKADLTWGRVVQREDRLSAWTRQAALHAKISSLPIDVWFQHREVRPPLFVACFFLSQDNLLFYSLRRTLDPSQAISRLCKDTWIIHTMWIMFVHQSWYTKYKTVNSYRLAWVSPGHSQVWDENHYSEWQPAAVPLLPLLSLQEYLGFSIHFKVNIPSAFFGTATFIFGGKQGKWIAAETHGLMAGLAQQYADSESQSTWESRSHGQQHSQVP